MLCRTVPPVALIVIAASQGGCIVLGPGTDSVPHQVERLDGVYRVLVRSDCVDVVVSKDIVVVDGEPNVESLRVAPGDRFRALGYIVEHTYRLRRISNGRAVFDRHGVRTPDAYVILLLPPPVVHEFDVVSVPSYDDWTGSSPRKERGSWAGQRRHEE